MYMPRHFEQADIGILHDAIDAFPLGALVTVGPDGPDANHIPFELNRAQGPFGTLRCHVARANPVWRAAREGEDRALVIFRGVSGYISPNWYATKQTTHQVVPTYNYAVVHAHGRIAVHDDPQWVRGLVARLTRRHESAQPRPWKMTDAPEDFLDAQLAQIVGLEIVVERLEGKWKMSQNRPAADRAGVIAGLREQGGPASESLADEVGRSQPPVA